MVRIAVGQSSNTIWKVNELSLCLTVPIRIKRNEPCRLPMSLQQHPGHFIFSSVAKKWFLTRCSPLIGTHLCVPVPIASSDTLCSKQRKLRHLFSIWRKQLFRVFWRSQTAEPKTFSNSWISKTTKSDAYNLTSQPVSLWQWTLYRLHRRMG